MSCSGYIDEEGPRDARDSIGTPYSWAIFYVVVVVVPR